MRNIPITSSHKTLMDAAMLSKRVHPVSHLDKKRIREIDSGVKGEKTWEAYNTPFGLFVITKDDFGGRFLRSFPDTDVETGSYLVVALDHKRSQFIFSDEEVLKTNANRRAAADLNLILA
jgi:hypothetical protein